MKSSDYPKAELVVLDKSLVADTDYPGSDNPPLLRCESCNLLLDLNTSCWVVRDLVRYPFDPDTGELNGYAHYNYDEPVHYYCAVHKRDSRTRDYIV